MAQIKGLINAKGKGGSGTPTKIFVAIDDYITITQDDLGSWSFPTSEIADIEFLTPQSENYPTESDFADGDLLYVCSEEVIEEDGDVVDVERTLQEIYEVRFIEDNSVVLQRKILIPQSSGGGSQSYQHNICLSNASDAFKLFLHITNDVSTKYTNASDVFNYIYNKGFVWEDDVTYQKKLFGCSGWVFNVNNEFIQVDSFIMISATQIKAYGFKGSTTKADYNVNTSIFTICKDIM